MPAVKNNDKEHPTTLHMKVAENLVELAPLLIDKTARKLADDEMDQRIDILAQVFKKLKRLVKELDKIRAKPDRFDEDGKPVGPLSFSKEDTDKRKKLREQIAKYESAINKAAEKGDISDASTIANEKDPAEGSGDNK